MYRVHGTIHNAGTRTAHFVATDFSEASANAAQALAVANSWRLKPTPVEDVLSITELVLVDPSVVV